MSGIYGALVTNAREVYRRDAPGTYSVLRTCCTELRGLLPRWFHAFHCMLMYIRRLLHYYNPLIAHNSSSVIDTLVCMLVCINKDLHNSCGSAGTQLDSFTPMWDLLMDHQELLWNMLNLCPRAFKQAWKVREKAAHLLRDMAVWFANEEIEQKLLEHHANAEIMLWTKNITRWEAVELYQSFCRKGPLSFQTIQCDAAIMSGDTFWLCSPLPIERTDYRLFFPENANPNVTRPFPHPDTEQGPGIESEAGALDEGSRRLEPLMREAGGWSP